MAGDFAVELDQVTKFYGSRPGLVDLSARIPKGSFVGLLGPNGSGKSTTLRILSCCIPPTSGTARICGLDVFRQSLEARRRLGYLPEHCPLYPDMRVIEYLRWTAGMKGLRSSNADRAVFEVLTSCSLDHVREQRIGTLSRGYRQRVGLASVLVHQPDVLILDEPTVGLDPLQVREFRKLIGGLKGKHTVVISSHILSEIEMLCDSVIILNEGWVVARGAPDELRSNVACTYTVECRCHPCLVTMLPHMVDRLNGFSLDGYEEDGEFARFRLCGRGADPRLDISRLLTEAGIELNELSRERLTLEDIFVHHTRGQSPGERPAPALEEATS